MRTTYPKCQPNRGQSPARHPKTMVALLLYAYCTGVVSSRKIEGACHVDVAFRVVCGNVAPDHTTIARFRARHEAALKSLFTASLRLCAKAGMTSVGLVAVDGTKMAAPASMASDISCQPSAPPKHFDELILAECKARPCRRRLRSDRSSLHLSV